MLGRQVMTKLETFAIYVLGEGLQCSNASISGLWVPATTAEDLVDTAD